MSSYGFVAGAGAESVAIAGWSGTAAASGCAGGTDIGIGVGAGGFGGAGFGFGFGAGGAVPVRGPGPGGAGDWLELRQLGIPTRTARSNINTRVLMAFTSLVVGLYRRAGNLLKLPLRQKEDTT